MVRLSVNTIDYGHRVTSHSLYRRYGRRTVRYRDAHYGGRKFVKRALMSSLEQHKHGPKAGHWVMESTFGLITPLATLQSLSQPSSWGPNSQFLEESNRSIGTPEQDFEWFLTNPLDISKLKGEYVAILDKKIIAHSKSIGDVMEATNARVLRRRPLIAFVPGEQAQAFPLRI